MHRGNPSDFIFLLYVFHGYIVEIINIKVKEKMEINEITGEIINCAIKVHKALGPGLLESIYEKCLAYELSKRGLKVEVQKEMPIVYDEIVIEGGYRLDLLVEEKVIVELKSVSEMKPIFTAQTLTYLKLANLRVALLINFNEVLLKNGIKRLVV